MATVHRARISPLLPPTEWALEDGELVERRGSRVRRFRLSELRRLTIADGLARADFPRGRVRIPARSFVSGLRLERHDDTFMALTEALAAQGAAAPQVRLGQVRPQVGEMVVWTIALCGAGAVAVIGAAGLIGAWALGLALAARLVFVLILAAAVLPWITRGRRITPN
ncbi:MAG: hypothetical protein Q7S93_07325 [Phenylobacterium sp.]|uniref:hypothetical protein n=1 Tax=Phenylobacterium sp. TaxID=1871053 RepID=UPI00271CBBBD|nr:hypothetical protein [Phenylobacterium sp.]MDO8409856.1 hypothetical protein [Phenylobacterium sp.]